MRWINQNKKHNIKGKVAYFSIIYRLSHLWVKESTSRGPCYILAVTFLVSLISPDSEEQLGQLAGLTCMLTR